MLKEKKRKSKSLDDTAVYNSFDFSDSDARPMLHEDSNNDSFNDLRYGDQLGGDESPKKKKKKKKGSSGDDFEYIKGGYFPVRVASKRVLASKTEDEATFIVEIEKAEMQAAKDPLYAPKKKKKGLKKLNESLKLLSRKNLNKEISVYGKNFTAKDYLTHVGTVLMMLVIASLLFGLQVGYSTILGFVAIATLPSILLTQARTASNNHDFENIVSYLDQMIINFKNTPKILVAMEQTEPFVDGRMQEKLREAINIIKTDANSPNVYKKAFEVIEHEFKNSRIKTLHKFMYTVEHENSVDYQESIDTLYKDSRAWQTRTYKFQNELKITKSKIAMLMLASVGIAWIFAYILRSVEKSCTVVENGVTTNTIEIINTMPYQIATIIFFILFILLYAYMETNITGVWLINDLESTDTPMVLHNMHQLGLIDKEKDQRFKRVVSYIALIFIVYGLYVQITSKNPIPLATGFGIYLIFTNFQQFKRKGKIKRVENAIRKEFPLWMRDVALSLKNRVVLRAIIESEQEAAYVLKPFINRFLINMEKNPASIVPYTTFLGNYDIQDITTAIKSLYAIRVLSAEDSQRQVNDLVNRNQELLAEAERLRQEDSIASVSMLSLLPMVIMSLLLMIYMIIMLIGFMSLIGGVG